MRQRPGAARPATPGDHREHPRSIVPSPHLPLTPPQFARIPALASDKAPIVGVHGVLRSTCETLRRVPVRRCGEERAHRNLSPPTPPKHATTFHVQQEIAPETGARRRETLSTFTMRSSKQRNTPHARRRSVCGRWRLAMASGQRQMRSSLSPAQRRQQRRKPRHCRHPSASAVPNQIL